MRIGNVNEGARYHRALAGLMVAAAGLMAGCSGSARTEVSSIHHALDGEDGLAEAYGVFKTNLANDGADQRFLIGFGYHPVLSTSKVVTANVVVNGTATLSFADGHVTATLLGVPETQGFDLWFVKNVAGPGMTVKPEIGDQVLKVGTFTPTTSFPPNHQELDINIGNGAGTGVNFDLDLVVVTLTGQQPSDNVIAIGARSLFEKRFFRERAGGSLDPVTGATLSSVETTDPLVARGAQLFFNETFGGNGRTCGTCHRVEHNLTIDAGFIATLPASDPLFVFESNPDLAGLEDGTLLRGHGLIRENVDGFEDPTHKFVERGVPHTLSMSTSTRRGDIVVFPTDGPPPDQRTGWSADGAPGRGTLNEFGLGAIFQHFTLTLQRRPGIDFRLPTQEEADALEAFQLFSGRQHNAAAVAVTFNDAAPQRGETLFTGQGQCVSCHRDLAGNNDVNLNADTGIDNLAFRTTNGLPKDGGFGTAGDATHGFGTGRFNVPPLFEAADTAPFFHNNAIETIEDAVAFYTGPEFQASPSRSFVGVITLTQDQINDIAAFLRAVNAADNMRAVRKRAQFVQSNRGDGNSEILTIAIADTGDAIRVLSEKNLGTTAVTELQTVQQTLQIALANPDANRPAFMDSALAHLGAAKTALIQNDPNGAF